MRLMLCSWVCSRYFASHDSSGPIQTDLFRLIEDRLRRDNNRCMITGHYNVYQAASEKVYDLRILIVK